MAVEVAKVELKTVQDASGLEERILAGQFTADQVCRRRRQDGRQRRRQRLHPYSRRPGLPPCAAQAWRADRSETPLLTIDWIEDAKRRGKDAACEVHQSMGVRTARRRGDHRSKAAVGGVAAAAIGDPAVFVSVDAMHQGPHGGGPVIAIVNVGE